MSSVQALSMMFVPGLLAARFIEQKSSATFLMLVTV
jgi:hypothetical protein